MEANFDVIDKHMPTTPVHKRQKAMLVAAHPVALRVMRYIKVCMFSVYLLVICLELSCNISLSLSDYLPRNCPQNRIQNCVQK